MFIVSGKSHCCNDTFTDVHCPVDKYSTDSKPRRVARLT